MQLTQDNRACQELAKSLEAYIDACGGAGDNPHEGGEVHRDVTAGHPGYSEAREHPTHHTPRPPTSRMSPWLRYRGLEAAPECYITHRSRYGGPLYLLQFLHILSHAVLCLVIVVGSWCSCRRQNRCWHRPSTHRIDVDGASKRIIRRKEKAPSVKRSISTKFVEGGALTLLSAIHLDHVTIGVPDCNPPPRWSILKKASAALSWIVKVFISPITCA